MNHDERDFINFSQSQAKLNFRKINEPGPGQAFALPMSWFKSHKERFHLVQSRKSQLIQTSILFKDFSTICRINGMDHHQVNSNIVPSLTSSGYQSTITPSFF